MLTAKQAKFVEEYLTDLCAAKAAVRAGYSPKRADAIGYENLRKPEIAAAIERRRQEISAATGITPEKVIQGFADGAFADLADCYNEDGTLKKIHDIPKSTRMALAGLEVDEIYVGQGEERTLIGQTKKIKKWDNHKYLDSLAKHFGLYNADTSEKSIGIPVNIKINFDGPKQEKVD